MQYMWHTHRQGCLFLAKLPFYTHALSIQLPCQRLLCALQHGVVWVHCHQGWVGSRNLLLVLLLLQRVLLLCIVHRNKTCLRWGRQMCGTRRLQEMYLLTVSFKLICC